MNSGNTQSKCHHVCQQLLDSITTVNSGGVKIERKLIFLGVLSLELDWKYCAILNKSEILNKSGLPKEIHFYAWLVVCMK